MRGRGSALNERGRARCGSVAVAVFRRAATENRLDRCRFFDAQFLTLRVVIDGPLLRIGQDAAPRADLRPGRLGNDRGGMRRTARRFRLP